MSERIVNEGWTSEKRRYYMTQNGFGQFWPRMDVKVESGGWCEIIIRNSNPFKTRKGAERFIDKLIEQDKKRAS